MSRPCGKKRPSEVHNLFRPLTPSLSSSLIDDRPHLMLPRTYRAPLNFFFQPPITPSPAPFGLLDYFLILPKLRLSLLCCCVSSALVAPPCRPWLDSTLPTFSFGALRPACVPCFWCRCRMQRRRTECFPPKQRMFVVCFDIIH